MQVEPLVMGVAWTARGDYRRRGIAPEPQHQTAGARPGGHPAEDGRTLHRSQHRRVERKRVGGLLIVERPVRVEACRRTRRTLHGLVQSLRRWRDARHLLPLVWFAEEPGASGTSAAPAELVRAALSAPDVLPPRAAVLRRDLQRWSGLLPLRLEQPSAPEQSGSVYGRVERTGPDWTVPDDTALA